MELKRQSPRKQTVKIRGAKLDVYEVYVSFLLKREPRDSTVQ